LHGSFVDRVPTEPINTQGFAIVAPLLFEYCYLRFRVGVILDATGVVLVDVLAAHLANVGDLVASGISGGSVGFFLGTFSNLEPFAVADDECA
jgi:hypothetical protein